MIYVWIILAVLLILVATPFVVGRFLPERYEGQVKVLFPKSPDAVWRALAEVEKHPMTGKMMKSVERQPDENGMPVWIEDMGRGEKITVKTLEWESPKRAVRDMTSTSAPMTSRWEYHLQPVNSGCEVTLKAETFIRSGKVIACMFRFMMCVGGGVRKGLQIQMDMIAQTLGVSAEYR